MNWLYNLLGDHNHSSPLSLRKVILSWHTGVLWNLKSHKFIFRLEIFRWTRLKDYGSYFSSKYFQNCSTETVKREIKKKKKKAFDTFHLHPFSKTALYLRKSFTPRYFAGQSVSDLQDVTPFPCPGITPLMLLQILTNSDQQPFLFFRTRIKESHVNNCCQQLQASTHPAQ